MQNIVRNGRTICLGVHLKSSTSLDVTQNMSSYCIEIIPVLLPIYTTQNLLISSGLITILQAQKTFKILVKKNQSYCKVDSKAVLKGSDYTMQHQTKH